MKTERSIRQTRFSSTLSDNELAEALKIANYADTVRQLDYFYGQVKRQLLQYQSPTTGLFPRISSEQNEAHVRDSLYCAMAIWALYQAYTKRIDDDNGKAHELGQSVVKCFRGVLFAWMRQSKDKVEPFKTNQSPKHALHSKFNLNTGLPFPEGQYGHLQIDVVSLYLLLLVQLINSGLQIIYTMDEVNFVQNLVYYVERAYRTPDFGIWERGSKYNDGTPEIHASSIGMAKSALEAVNGCNLFGEKGASWSVIYVDIDAHSRNRSIFETLLPRESSSKNIDVSLLPTISWPCFATHDELLYKTTKLKMLKRLKGRFGFKRFLWDGYGTVLEKNEKQNASKTDETKQYENIESEWPLIVCFLIIDGIFKNNEEQVKEYSDFLMNQLVKRDPIYGDYLLPKYYYTTEECLEKERAEPGSTTKVASAEGSDYSCLFLMGQSVLIITRLLTSCLLHITELDPIRRCLPSYNRPRKSGRYSAFQGIASDLVVQVVLIAESMRLQAMMATYGIQTQTPLEVEPVQIWAPSQLVQIYEFLGVNKKLGLKGRPSRPIGALGTSKLYRICGQTILCYPLIFEVSDFYLSHDMALLIDDIKNELHFVGKYWRMSGRPTVCVLIREEHLRDVHFREMLDLLAQFKKGFLDSGLKVKTGRLQNLISSSCIEHLDFLHLLPNDALPKLESYRQLEHTVNVGYQSLTDIPKALVYNEPMDENYRAKIETLPTFPDLVDALKHSDTLYAQSQLLGVLWDREGPYFCVSENVTVRERLERLSRQAGTLRHWSVVRYCSGILKKLVDSISPCTTSILVNGRRITIGSFGKVEHVIDYPLTPKEIHTLIYNTISDPYEAVLQQEIILYVGRLVSTSPELFQGVLKIRIGSVVEAMKVYLKFKNEKESKLESLSPSQIRKVLFRVLSDTDLTMEQRRKVDGALCRVPRDFYDKVWEILCRVNGGLIIAGQHIQSKTVAKMSQNELSFALLVETYMGKISSPEYRQINVELLITLFLILERNPELNISEKLALDLDKVIAEAVNKYKDSEPNCDLNSFYREPKAKTTSFLARTTLDTLLRESPPECKIS
ncbi:putative phosphorylase b kinase regulatory subunit beta-like protein [Leptotrombidium deliense]|uniref:Phosphorylase b kinase regulatory subunit n=1 Tax=Leptotrombidium deliense TaxID=299467 RepID=A0A443SPT1_9ACAR|nr:putative phosphorylase b kinase regulatory subunit beta-like protein [Leptotrombidium deliense]